MNNHEQTQTRSWITVDEASAICVNEGLNRTKKTIRLWCRQGHVKAQKQTIPTGERWVLDKASLSIKLNEEKELQAMFTPVRTGSNMNKPANNKTRSDLYSDDAKSDVRHGSDWSERVRTSADQSEQVRALEEKVLSLKTDKAVRDQQIAFLTKHNDEGRENLLSQSRYIGHLETKLAQLGGKPDQAFLSAPLPKSSDEPEFQNPQQTPLYTG